MLKVFGKAILSVMMLLLVAGAGKGYCLEPSPSDCDQDAMTNKTSGIYCITVSGKTKYFLVHVPESYSPRSRVVPMLMGLHGGTGDADYYQSEWGWDVLSESEGFIGVYPYAASRGTIPGIWRLFPDRTQDDHLFLKEVIKYMKRAFRVDEDRVYITGHSLGATMVHSFLAKGNARLFAGAVTYKGGFLTASKDPTTNVCYDPATKFKPGGALPVTVWTGGEENVRTGDSGCAAWRKEQDKTAVRTWATSNRIPAPLGEGVTGTLDGNTTVTRYFRGYAPVQHVYEPDGTHDFGRGQEVLVWNILKQWNRKQFR